MAGPLHLRAEDAEDLAVISSCLQDALVPLNDMRYDRAARRFVLAVNRFRWEGCEPCVETALAYGHDGVFERIASAITFDGVGKASVLGIDQGKREHPLELLAIMTGEAAATRIGAPDVPGAATVLLVFAGGGMIRLEVDRIGCRLEDFGEPWPTQWRPRHRIEPESV